MTDILLVAQFFADINQTTKMPIDDVSPCVAALN